MFGIHQIRAARQMRKIPPDEFEYFDATVSERRKEVGNTSGTVNAMRTQARVSTAKTQKQKVAVSEAVTSPLSF